MSERLEAIAVLQQAREILAARLTEMVLEQAEDILADARGDSYMNEIDSLYEQLGIKLAHVSHMISNLPAETESRGANAKGSQSTAEAQRDDFRPDEDPRSSFYINIETLLPALVGPVCSAALALPAPRATVATSARATQLSLQAFAAQIQAGDLLAAGRTLGALLDLEPSRAVVCAATFAQRARTEGSFFRKAMQLRTLVEDGEPGRIAVLLFDCFGLTREEALATYETLQRRLRIR